MARGRPRKRDSRMDAAIDAMTREMGFDERLVRATVKELLKVYGVRGSPDQGWPFIEEFSYKLLIEQLLEKQQDGAENRDASPQGDAAPPDDAAPLDDAAPSDDAAPYDDAAQHDDAASHVDAAPYDDAAQHDDAAPYDDAASHVDGAPHDDASAAVGPSSIVILPTFSGAVDSKLQTQDACDSTSQTNGLIHASLIKITGAKECLPVDTLALRRCKPCYGWAFSNDGEGPVEQKLGLLAESGANECLPVDTLAPRRRKPCYGWAFSNDGEGPVELQSGPLAESGKLLIRPAEKRKRKSGWDVRHEDMQSSFTLMS